MRCDQSKVPLSHEAQLEAMVNQLSAQMQSLAAPGGGVNVSPNVAPGATVPSNIPSPANPSTTGGVAVPGQSLPPNPPPGGRFDSPATLESKEEKIVLLSGLAFVFF